MATMQAVFLLGPETIELREVPVPEPGPGELLVSSVVKNLVTGSGIAFEDRGAFTLKGVPGEWQLFRVLT